MATLSAGPVLAVKRILKRAQNLRAETSEDDLLHDSVACKNALVVATAIRTASGIG